MKITNTLSTLRNKLPTTLAMQSLMNLTKKLRKNSCLSLRWTRLILTCNSAMCSKVRDPSIKIAVVDGYGGWPIYLFYYRTTIRQPGIVYPVDKGSWSGTTNLYHVHHVNSWATSRCRCLNKNSYIQTCAHTLSLTLTYSLSLSFTSFFFSHSHTYHYTPFKTTELGKSFKRARIFYIIVNFLLSQLTRANIFCVSSVVFRLS